MLIQQLPDSSRTKTAHMEAFPTDRWGALEYEIADLIDVCRQLIMVTAYHQSGKKPPEIKPYPRPTDVQRERARQSAVAQAQADRFQNMINMTLAKGSEPEVSHSPEEA